MKSIYRIFVIIIMIQFLVNCDAPRENPLDPENPDSKTALLSGRVMSETRSPEPLSGVEAYWKNSSASVYTGSDGRYSLVNINRSDGWIFFLKDGFETDSIYIEWQGRKNLIVDASLNAYPVLEDAAIYTMVKNRYSKPEFQLITEAFITDSDDDVDTVYFVNQDLRINMKLNKISAELFGADFTDYELGLSSLDDTIGKDFQYIVAESDGTYRLIGTSGVKRIIKEEIEYISPKNKESVSSTPILKWKRFQPGFQFYYYLEIYTDESDPQLVWQKDSVSSGAIEYTVDTPIEINELNEFFWVIWCIDEFQNRSRSKPATFVVADSLL